MSWFKIVFDAGFAARVLAIRDVSALPEGASDTAVLPGARDALPPRREAAPRSDAGQRDAPAPRTDAALRLLALLQREGRLVDFCEEELSGFPDAQVGAAARSVHAGCRKALREAFAPVALREEPEGAEVVLDAGFDPRAVRLTGNVAGNPPFRGTLRHHGWRASAARLPVSDGDPSLLAPAEVELA
ncbi:MAG TPA: DUF2760 domain-containing protein [Myxococcales bacterium]